MSFTTRTPIPNYIIVDAATGTDTCAYPPVLFERQVMKRDGTYSRTNKLVYTGKDNIYTTSTGCSKSFRVPVFYTPFINKHGNVTCEFYRLPMYNKAGSRKQQPITPLYENYEYHQRRATKNDYAYAAAYHKMRHEELLAIEAKNKEYDQRVKEEYEARVAAQRERL